MQLLLRLNTKYLNILTKQVTGLIYFKYITFLKPCVWCHLKASMTYEVGVAPALRLGFQDKDTDVRLTSVTSGLDGALGIKFGSVGLPGWTGAPNSKTKKHEHVTTTPRITSLHAAQPTRICIKEQWNQLQYAAGFISNSILNLISCLLFLSDFISTVFHLGDVPCTSR